MKELKRVSRWITVFSIGVTEKHRLYCYGNDYDVDETGKRIISVFRWNGRLYAIDQFISRFSMWGFDHDCNEYPAFISGYDGENYWTPLLMEIDEWGEKVRLYVEK